MKGLILKDILNIYKGMLKVMIILAVCMLPSLGMSGYIVALAVMCSSMTLTTFAIDERTNWTKYALIMPVTRKEYVFGKYMSNLIFTGAGAAAGFIVAAATGIVKGNLDMLMNLSYVASGVIAGIVLGDIYMPLIIKFGTDQARIIFMAAAVIPGLIFVLSYKAVKNSGIVITRQFIAGGIAGFIVLLILLTFFSVRISIKIMENQEF